MIKRKLVTTVAIMTMLCCVAGCKDNPSAINNSITVAENDGTTVENSNGTVETKEGTTAADTTTGTEPSARVELSVKDLVESVVLEEFKLADGVTYQEVANYFGAEYYGAEVDENMAFNSAAAYADSADGSVEYEVGLFYFDGEGVKYGVSAYDKAGALGDSYTQITFDTVGNFLMADTHVEDVALLSSSNGLLSLQGCAAYIRESMSVSLPAFITSLGLDQLDANFVTTAESIMAGQFTSCSGTFETEYGPAEVALSSFTVNPEYPTGYMSIKFKDSSAPVGGISFTESYYGTFFDSSKKHAVSLSVGNEVF